MITLDSLKTQYHEVVAILHAFDIHEAPNWEIIQAHVTPEILLLAAKIAEPRLLLVPPLSRLQMVAAIDKQIGRHGIMKPTYFDQPENNDLWSDGKPEEPKWEVWIVDASQAVHRDPSIYWSGEPEKSLSRTNREQIILWIDKCKAQGLDVLSGLRAYLALMMLSLAQGKPIDHICSTIINPNIVIKDSKALLAQASWSDDSICLNALYPFQSDDDLSLRATIKVSF